MAIVENGNSVYIDTTGQATDTEKPVKVHYIVFTTSSAGDQIVLKDKDTNGSTKLSIRHNTATDSILLDFSNRPLFFPNGIYVSTLSSSATATLIGSSGGT